MLPYHLKFPQEISLITIILEFTGELSISGLVSGNQLGEKVLITHLLHSRMCIRIYF